MHMPSFNLSAFSLPVPVHILQSAACPSAKHRSHSALVMIFSSFSFPCVYVADRHAEPFGHALAAQAEACPPPKHLPALPVLQERVVFVEQVIHGHAVQSAHPFHRIQVKAPDPPRLIVCIGRTLHAEHSRRFRLRHARLQPQPADFSCRGLERSVGFARKSFLYIRARKRSTADTLRTHDSRRQMPLIAARTPPDQEVPPARNPQKPFHISLFGPSSSDTKSVTLVRGSFFQCTARNTCSAASPCRA